MLTKLEKKIIKDFLDSSSIDGDFELPNTREGERLYLKIENKYRKENGLEQLISAPSYLLTSSCLVLDYLKSKLGV